MNATPATIVAGTSSPAASSTGWRRGLSVAGVGAGLTAAVATELFGRVADFAGVTMRAGNVGASTSEPITVGTFAMGTLICTFWGTIIAAAITRRAKQPQRTFTRFALGLTTLSMIAPLLAGDTRPATKATLALSHIIAAAIIIPTLTKQLPTQR